MAIPQRLRQRLKHALGDEAATDMSAWLEGVDEMRGNIVALRHEMDVLRLEQRAEFAEFRRVIQQELAQLNIEIRDTRTDLGGVQSNVMKWSFAFWLGAVLAIAALAGALK